MMKYLKSFLIVLNFTVLLVLLVFIGFYLGQHYSIALNAEGYPVVFKQSPNEQKLKKLLSLIENEYVQDVNADTLLDNSIRHLMSQLDPHSSYLTENQSLQAEEEMTGSFEGIGIEFRIRKDTLVVQRVVETSPNVGKLHFGDKILSINEQSITGEKAYESGEIIRYKSKEVLLTKVKRGNDVLNITLKKSTIPLNSVTSAFMLNKQLGYIKLERFGERSPEEVRVALNKLKKSGMQRLVLDLRDNPGGWMEASEVIADEFLENGKLIVYTEDKNGKRENKKATNYGNFEGQKVYVLINENTASAGEILAGALQEYDIGTIVGRRSFGKGLIQKEISMGDGTKVRLTTAKYFTPSGRSIQKPFENEDVDDYYGDIYDRYKNGELMNQDSIKVDKTREFVTPSGKVVYGGGGIYPDVFVGLDGPEVHPLFFQIGGQAAVDNFLFEYLPGRINNPNFSSYEFFTKSNEVEQALEAFLSENPELARRQNTHQKEQLKFYMNAEMVNLLFGREAFQKVWHAQDAMIQKVLTLDKN